MRISDLSSDVCSSDLIKDYADELKLEKLSDLKGKSVVLAAHPDCAPRADCAKGLEDDYGIKISKVLTTGFATDATYKSVLDGESQLGLTSTSDGTLEEQGLVLLEDDRAIQPVQNLVPAVSKQFIANRSEEHTSEIQ